MEGRLGRRLQITVRAAADTPAAGSPYVVLELGDQKISTASAITAGSNPVWDEPIELRLPPPMPHERPLQLRIKLLNRIRLFPDRSLASGSMPLDDMLYGGGQHELTVPLSDGDAKPAGQLHLGLVLEKLAGPGEEIGSAAGTVLGEVQGGGPSTPGAAAVPSVVLPSAAQPEVQAREVLGAGPGLLDPSKPGFGLYLG